MNQPNFHQTIMFSDSSTILFYQFCQKKLTWIIILKNFFAWSKLFKILSKICKIQVLSKILSKTRLILARFLSNCSQIISDNLWSKLQIADVNFFPYQIWFIFLSYLTNSFARGKTNILCQIFYFTTWFSSFYDAAKIFN